MQGQSGVTGKSPDGGDPASHRASYEPSRVPRRLLVCAIIRAYQKNRRFPMTLANRHTITKLTVALIVTMASVQAGVIYNFVGTGVTDLSPPEPVGFGLRL